MLLYYGERNGYHPSQLHLPTRLFIRLKIAFLELSTCANIYRTFSLRAWPSEQFVQSVYTTSASADHHYIKIIFRPNANIIKILYKMKQKKRIRPSFSWPGKNLIVICFYLCSSVASMLFNKTKRKWEKKERLNDEYLRK